MTENERNSKAIGDELRIQEFVYEVLDRRINLTLSSRSWIANLERGKIRIPIRLEGDGEHEGLLDGILNRVQLEVLGADNVRQGLPYILQKYFDWHDIERDGITFAGRNLQALGDVLYILVPTNAHKVRTSVYNAADVDDEDGRCPAMRRLLGME